jgi:aryl-alcohol dehydrogenase-like predicted oxidoreductase
MNSYFSKLALGTVQFGLSYGINNKRGQIPKPEIFEILNKAFSAGIDSLDTAGAYGESEEIIGEFIKKEKKHFKIISKLTKNASVNVAIENSLRSTGRDFLDGYLLHSFDEFKKNSRLWEDLQEAKKAGKVKRIGFSLYYPEELQYILEKDIGPDIIQVPYNVFDRRFEPYFNKLKVMGVEIHTRSAFLQGLFFIEPDKLSEYFKSIKEKAVFLHGLADESKVPLYAVLLNYVMQNPDIDRAVVGVDGLKHLREILSCEKYNDQTKLMMDELNTLKENNEDILLPSKWKK